jgi:hypothetical protein
VSLERSAAIKRRTWGRARSVARQDEREHRRVLWLWLCGALMVVPLLGFSWRYSLWEHGPRLTDIGKLAAYSTPTLAGYLGGMALLFALYLLALRASLGLPGRHALPAIFGCALPMLACMVCLYPTNAIDVFLYAVRSRLLTSYGVDPNSVPFERYPDDPWNQFITGVWAERVSPYGPLWNQLSAPVTWLAGDDMLGALVLYKLMMAAGLVAGAWVIVQLLRAFGRESEAGTGALLYLWNPLVLWEGVGNAHNDVLVTLLVLLALWAWAARRGGLVVPALLLAALIKYVTLPLIPLAAVALWRQAAGTRARLRVAAQTLALSLLALLGALFPFYDFAALWSSLSSQNRQVYTSPTSFALALLRERSAFDTILGWSLRLGLVLLALTLLWQLWRVWRRPERLPRACFEVLFVLVLAALASSRAWYLIWLVGLAAVLPWGWPAWRAIAWTIGHAASYALLIWVNAWWDLGFDPLQLVVVPLLLGGPLLLTLAELTRARPTLQLGLLGAGTLGCWLGLARLFPLERYAERPSFSLMQVPAALGTAPLLATTLLLAALCALYIAGYALLRATPRISASLKATLTGLVLGGCLLNLLTHPIGAVDVFYYLTQLKLRFYYGENPYLTTFLPAFAADPFARVETFLSWPLVYGPGWLLLSAPATLFGVERLLPPLLGYKVLSLLWTLLAGLLIFRANADQRRAWLAAYLFLANPLVLFEAVGNAHNDVMLAALLVAAVVAASRQARLALPLGVLAALVKALALPLLPALALALWRRGISRRGLLLSGAAALALGVALTLPFWQGGAMLGGLARAVESQQTIKTAALFSLAREYLATQGAADSTLALARLVFAGLFGLGWLLVTLRVRSLERAHACLLLLLYLLVSSLFPWYLVPVIALLALDDEAGGRAYVLIASTLALLSYPFVVWALTAAGLSQFQMLLWLTLFLTWPAVVYVLHVIVGTWARPSPVAHASYSQQP